MQVLNKKNVSELTKDHLYIGRGSIYGNPFEMQTFRNDRDLVIDLYRHYFYSQISNRSDLYKGLKTYKDDLDLVCFCAPESCHGDVIKEFLDFTKTYDDFDIAAEAYLNTKNHLPLPNFDGVNHINIYSKSLCALGKLASNFSYTPFELNGYGKFASMEAFWFYIGTGSKHEELRPLYGNRAKMLGKTFEKVFNPDFLTIIEQGIRAKVEQTPSLKKMIEENNLPWKHYYFYGDLNRCKVVKEGNGFLESVYTKISRELGKSYNVIVAGSRDIKDFSIVSKAIVDSKFRINSIVEGGAKGVDTYGFYYGKVNRYEVITIPITKEEWRASKNAGVKRNIKMGDFADKAVIVIKNNSSGSTHMEKYMRSLGKEVFVVNI